MKDLDVRNMRTVLEETLYVNEWSERRRLTRGPERRTRLCGIPVGIRHGGRTARKDVGRLRVPRGERSYAVGQEWRQCAVEYTAGDIVVLEEWKVARKALKEDLHEMHEHRRVGHGAVTRVKQWQCLARSSAVTLRA
jgi:hypothetical protein